MTSGLDSASDAAFASQGLPGNTGDYEARLPAHIWAGCGRVSQAQKEWSCVRACSRAPTLVLSPDALVTT